MCSNQLSKHSVPPRVNWELVYTQKQMHQSTPSFKNNCASDNLSLLVFQRLARVMPHSIPRLFLVTETSISTICTDFELFSEQSTSVEFFASGL